MKLYASNRLHLHTVLKYCVVISPSSKHFRKSLRTQLRGYIPHTRRDLEAPPPQGETSDGFCTSFYKHVMPQRKGWAKVFTEGHVVLRRANFCKLCLF